MVTALLGVRLPVAQEVLILCTLTTEETEQVKSPSEQSHRK